VSISVPSELKEGMGQVASGVNWSAVACGAFQEKVTRFEGLGFKMSEEQGLKRLRESAERHGKREEEKGVDAGKAWALKYADAEQLELLSNLWEALGDSASEFFGDDSRGYSPADRLYFVMFPHNENDQKEAKTFWECQVGVEGPVHDSFVEG